MSHGGGFQEDPKDKTINIKLLGTACLHTVGQQVVRTFNGVIILEEFRREKEELRIVDALQGAWRESWSEQSRDELWA